MTPQEYDNKLIKIQEKFKLEKTKLGKEYAFSNSPQGVGDIVKDHKCIIKIEKIRFSMNLLKYPECVYVGKRLKKDLTPFKSGERETVYQSNMETT